MKKIISITVNGVLHEAALEPNMTLVDFLRQELRLTGTKKGCGIGDCGACTVLMDGVPVFSCLVLAMETDGCDIRTIEGIAEGNKLHPLQEAFVEKGAIQCGFCTPGMIMSSLALLDKNPNPTESDVRRALSGNLCRCTGYQKIVEAVLTTSKTIKTATDKHG